jgi:dTMP kinase
MFITFEGIDFSGKSLQLKLLGNYLVQKGIKFIATREPGGDPLCEKIRELLLDKSNLQMCSESEFLLFASSRAQLTRKIIVPYLKEGYWVLSDRFLDSSVAYQSYGRGLKKETINFINKFAIDDYFPDITFYLHISYDEMLKRKALAGRVDIDRIELSDREFFENVINGYVELANQEKRIKLINGEQDIETIHLEIISILKNYIEDLK